AVPRSVFPAPSFAPPLESVPFFFTDLIIRLPAASEKYFCIFFNYFILCFYFVILLTICVEVIFTPPKSLIGNDFWFI
ncbi:MAG: hypothetical protein SOS50_00370, partial [Oliverpabstia sp.]|nr:hypothetical protein [Oliverpabstia sp.]